MINIRWMMRMVILLLLVGSINGCTATDTPEKKLSATASPTQERKEGELVILSPDEALRFDAEAYAKKYGVSVEEAIERLQSQEEIGSLNHSLTENEPDTFGGLWIEHEPEYKVVTLFTRDGEQTIRPYLEGKSIADLVEVRPARYTLAELNTIYDQTIQELKKLDFEVSSGIDLQGNRVEIVVGDQEWFELELNRVGAQLPEGAELSFTEGASTAKDKDLILTPPVPGIAFPRLKPTEGYQMCLLLEMIGTLRMEDSCLYVQPLGSDKKLLVVWPSTYSLRLEEGQVMVINGSGEEVVRVGEEVYLGGGGDIDAWISQQIPEACRGETFIANCGNRPNLIFDSELFNLEVITDTQRTALFLQSRPPLVEQAEGPVSIEGKLESDSENRCLHVQKEWGAVNLIWPMDWSARVEDGVVIVRDVAGEIVAREGDALNLPGRKLPSGGDYPVYMQLIHELPGDCIGTSWLVDGGD